MTRLIDADALNYVRVRIYHNDGTVGGYNAMVPSSEIKNAPTVDVEPRWIPCSDRFPPDLEPVNVTWINRDPEPYYVVIKDKPFTATAVYYKGKWYWWSSTCTDMLAEYGHNEIDEVDERIDIVAWMPLPLPWKEVEE